jgi:hypothetical protein
MNPQTRRALIAALGIVGLLTVPSRSISSHPLHMSFTDVRFVDGGKVVELSIRVFANDFAAAAARFSRTSLGPDSTVEASRSIAYLTANIRVAGKTGAPLPLISCGMTTVAEMLKFCFRAAMGKHSDAPLRVSNTIMTELFRDQVNVVQSSAGGRRASRMFVHGDGWKTLP